MYELGNKPFNLMDKAKVDRRYQNPLAKNRSLTQSLIDHITPGDDDHVPQYAAQEISYPNFSKTMLASCLS